MSDESEQKSEQASKRKLRKQREQGSLPRSADMASILNLVISIVIIVGTATTIMEQYSDLFDDVFTAMFLTEGSNPALGLQAVIRGVLVMTVPILVGSLAFIIVVVTLYQGGLPFSMQPLVPNFNRLNPAEGFGRMFNQRSWVEALFQLIRAAIWIIVSALVIWSIWGALLRIDLCGGICGLTVFQVLIYRWLPVALFVLLAFAGIEIIVQKGLYMKEQMMSKSELKRENKEQTGAPELRRERNRLRNQLAKEAENADPELANMCFYYGDVAVGIRYNPEDTPTPRVTARGKGEDAAALRRYISERGHPEMVHEKLAKKGYRISPGATINKEMFEDLAYAMTKMFGKK